MRFIAENLALPTHPCKQFDQLAFIINLMATPHKKRIHLSPNTEAMESAVSAAVIPTLCKGSDFRVATMAQAGRHLHFVAISRHTMETNDTKKTWIPIHVIERLKTAVESQLEHRRADDDQNLRLDASARYDH